jgi:hypothetical protein
MVEISIDDLIIGGILLLSIFYLAWEYPTQVQREIYFMNRFCMCPESSESEEEEDVDKKDYSSSEEVVNKKD